jgi:hypothetical protein
MGKFVAVERAFRRGEFALITRESSFMAREDTFTVGEDALTNREVLGKVVASRLMVHLDALSDRR